MWLSNSSSTIDCSKSANRKQRSNTFSNQWHNDHTKNKNNEKRYEHVSSIYTPKCICILCFLIGSLFGGIILTVVIMLWLTSFTATSTTSTTSATSTSTTSSTSTTTTTPAAPCVPTSVGSASTLLTISSPTVITYNCYAYTWTSPTTGPVNLTFELRNDPSQWVLDDTSIYDGAIQMLTNIGFETGSLSPWVRTTPHGACTGTPGSITNSSCHSGTYCMYDGSLGCADQISQQFTATAGEVYVVSFWLRAGTLAPVTTATVTLS
ncbi:unnamed protein product [Rotaria socialis]|uniref:Uncharacterized protein n=1 Tax=Rotaria socialis TaxID=392032 RepID=A0A817STZ0_9BILA|nr:unnamed protein product [Rotaria socialis]